MDTERAETASRGSDAHREASVIHADAINPLKDQVQSAPGMGALPAVPRPADSPPATHGGATQSGRKSKLLWLIVVPLVLSILGTWIGNLLCVKPLAAISFYPTFELSRVPPQPPQVPSPPPPQPPPIEPPPTPQYPVAPTPTTQNTTQPRAPKADAPLSQDGSADTPQPPIDTRAEARAKYRRWRIAKNIGTEGSEDRQPRVPTCGDLPCQKRR
jgi:hypothetical protein